MASPTTPRTCTCGLIALNITLGEYSAWLSPVGEARNPFICGRQRPNDSLTTRGGTCNANGRLHPERSPCREWPAAAQRHAGDLPRGCEAHGGAECEAGNLQAAHARV